MLQIGFLGPEGSFSHTVTLHAFPNDNLRPFETITEVIKSFENKEVSYAVVPIENAIEGTVHETLDYLYHQAKIQAVAEIIQPIKQQLLATSSGKPIEKIFSHPQAIAQGKKFVNQYYPGAQIELTASTAYAARFVAEHPEANYAAIAPQIAAERYGLTVVAQDIHEISENFTRFWILGDVSPTLPVASQAKKISLALTLPDNLPGALHKALATFAWRGIDLTKLESRPLKTTLGEYFFIVDAKYDHPPLLAYALEEMASMGITYKILGKYDVFQMESLK